MVGLHLGNLTLLHGDPDPMRMHDVEEEELAVFRHLDLPHTLTVTLVEDDVCLGWASLTFLHPLQYSLLIIMHLSELPANISESSLPKK